MEALEKGPHNFLFDVILNAEVSVDSFFLMSGCLLGFLTFKEMDSLKSRGQDNPSGWGAFWGLYYLHRFLR